MNYLYRSGDAMRSRYGTGAVRAADDFLANPEARPGDANFAQSRIPTAGGLYRGALNTDTTGDFQRQPFNIATGTQRPFYELPKALAAPPSVVQAPKQNAAKRWMWGNGGDATDLDPNDQLSPERRMRGLYAGRINAHAAPDTKQFSSNLTPEADWRQKFKPKWEQG